MALDYLRYLAGENYREKATEWFENYYGTEAFEPVGREGLIGQWSEKLAQVLDERDEARHDVARLTSELNLTKNTATEPEALTGVIHPRDPRRICYNPIGTMELGSMCSDCGHHATAHTDSGSGPCLLCFLEAKFA